MNLFNYRSSRMIALAALISLAAAFPASAHAAASRDILWDIISNCVDANAADYCQKCRWPRPETACAKELICRETTEVWAENDAFVALRDRKMCGCPDDFVHGLAIPRSRVAGVEDARRPEAIWAFAWETAIQRIGDAREAALAVNPAEARAQDQLHVHIVRLQKDARQRFSNDHVSRVRNLDKVWGEAARVAAAAGLTDYGILVTSHPEGGFIVVVDQESPEKEYVLERCK